MPGSIECGVSAVSISLHGQNLKIRKTGYEIEIYDTGVLVEVMQRC